MSGTDASWIERNEVCPAPFPECRPGACNCDGVYDAAQRAAGGEPSVARIARAAFVHGLRSLLAERDAALNEANARRERKVLCEQLEGRVAVLEAALRETRETLWRVSQYDRMVIGYAGELQEAALSLDAVLAAGDAAPQTDNPGGDEVARSGGGS